MAAALRADGLRPDLVLCSTARRTRDTLALLGPAVADAAVEIDDELYGADPITIIERLRSVDPDLGSVMVIGHNPGLQDLALHLAGDGDPAALAQLRMKFPTAALAVLDLERGTWATLDAGQAYLARVVLPRDLPP